MQTHKHALSLPVSVSLCLSLSHTHTHTHTRVLKENLKLIDEISVLSADSVPAFGGQGHDCELDGSPRDLHPSEGQQHLQE
jgi:hypothetical protein